MNKNDIKRLYLEEGKTRLEIARIMGCSKSKIDIYLSKFNIRKSNNYLNMVGKKFGYLTVLKLVKKQNKTRIICKCDCDAVKKLNPLTVLKGKIVSCGCFKNMNLKKGQIKANNIVSKKIMQEEVDKGKTDIQIAEDFGFNRLTIGRLRREYKIKSKFSDKKSYLNEKFLSDEQREIMMGSALGDSYICPAGTIAMAHSSNQYPYIYWMHHKLKPFSFKLSSNEKTNSFKFSTKSLDFLKHLRNQMYPKGKKIVSEEILWKLTPLSLAVWFMDNGGLMGSNNHLSTHGFSHKDRKLIVDYFKQKWNIVTTIRKNFNKKQNKYYYSNFFSAENSFKFTEIIKYHLLPCMLYKINSPWRNHVIYLAGGMQSSPDHGVKWRRNLKSLLNQKGYYCIDPTKEEDFILLDDDWKSVDNMELFKKNMRRIIDNDIDFVRLADTTICLYDDFIGGGSYHEVGEAYLKHKKLYILNINDIPLSEMSWWVIGCATKIVNTYQELLDLFPPVNNLKYIRTNGLKGKKRKKQKNDLIK